jgi:hypothetical protein
VAEAFGVARHPSLPDTPMPRDVLGVSYRFFLWSDVGAEGKGECSDRVQGRLGGVRLGSNAQVFAPGTGSREAARTINAARPAIVLDLLGSGSEVPACRKRLVLAAEPASRRRSRPACRTR